MLTYEIEFRYSDGVIPVYSRKKRLITDWEGKLVRFTISLISSWVFLRRDLSSSIVYSIIQSFAVCPVTYFINSVRYLGEIDSFLA